MDKRIRDFIGEKAEYDKYGSGYIWGCKGDKLEMIADVRGWGSIQTLFMNEDGEVDYTKAEEFQDELGQWIAQAISEKLQRESEEE